jgi:hypothetical protein
MQNASFQSRRKLIGLALLLLGFGLGGMSVQYWFMVTFPPHNALTPVSFKGPAILTVLTITSAMVGTWLILRAPRAPRSGPINGLGNGTT